jgi:hypothetical protein
VARSRWSGPGGPAAGPGSGPAPRARSRPATPAGRRSGPAPPAGAPQPDDPPLDPDRCPPRRPERRRRPVDHPGRPTAAPWSGRPGTVRPPTGRTSHPPRHTEPAAAAPSPTTAHYGGPRGPPGRRCRCGDPHRCRRSSPTSRSSWRVAARHQRPWAEHLERPGCQGLSQRLAPDPVDHGDAAAVDVGHRRTGGEEHPDDLDLKSIGLGRSACAGRCDRQVQRG